MSLAAAALLLGGSGLAGVASTNRQHGGSAEDGAAIAGRTVPGADLGTWNRLSGAEEPSPARRPRRRPANELPPSPPEAAPAGIEPEPRPGSDGTGADEPGTPDPAGPEDVKPPPPAAAFPAGRVPAHFIRNDGQLDEAVRFYMKGARGTVYLTAEEIVYDFFSARRSEHPPGDGAGEGAGEDEEPVSRLVFRMRFLQASPGVLVEGRRELPGKINYFVGDRENWRTAIPTFEEVAYRDLYPGVDLVCGFRDGSLACRGTIAPGADPGPIALRYSGVEGLEIDPGGDLIVRTAFGGFRTPAPRIHQEIGGERISREGAFMLRDDFTAGFAIGSYDRESSLIVEF